MNRVAEIHNYLNDGIQKVLEVSTADSMLWECIQREVPFLTVSDPFGSVTEQITRRNITIVPYDFLDEDCYFGRYELLFSVNTFHRFTRPQLELLQLRRLIHKGGRVLIFDREDPGAGYTLEGTLKKLQKAEFLNIESRLEDGLFILTGVK